MNNLIRLVEGQACIVSDDPWQLDAEGDAPLILPLTAWRERQPAAVLEWAANLQFYLGNGVQPLLIAGLASDQAKLLRWRSERIALPAKLLDR